MIEKFTFTVFTPTYNRASTLHRAYESLKVQTFRDFEWLIVDDGSTDNTEALVREWQTEANFPIRYLWKENEGKHIAFNVGVGQAQGCLFFPLDSDDTFMPNTLECVKHHWDRIPRGERQRFTGVTGFCSDQHGKPLVTNFPGNLVDSDSLEIRYCYKVKGHFRGFHRTEVLKCFPFPEIEGVSFVPEGLVWKAIARCYKTRYVCDPVYVYWSDDHGTAKQLTKEQDPTRHAKALVLLHLSTLNNEIEWLGCAPAHFGRSAIHYGRFSFHTGANIVDQFRKLGNWKAKVLWGIILPFALALYLKDSRTNPLMSGN